MDRAPTDPPSVAGAPELTLEPGRVLGPYRIEGKIGEGGMGVVYRARDERLGRFVALKILPTADVGDRDRLRRFEQEARSASALNHPGIVTIHEIGTAAGVHFIAQELVEGVSLRSRLSHGKLSVDGAIAIGIQIADALAAAHAAGVIHRDIKPENLMLRPDGRVKVLDFGLAKLMPQTAPGIDDATATVLTRRDVIVGTTRYMSPEQARGAALDRRSDLFSFGVVLYEMLAGKAPFDGASTADVIAAILERTPPALASVVRGVPNEVEQLVAKALRKSADERYQSAEELVADLKAVQRAPMQPAPARRPRAVLAAAAIGLVSLLAAGGWLLWGRPSPALTDRDTVLLTAFENATGEAAFDGGTLRQALATHLRQTPFLSLFPDQGIQSTLALMARRAGDPVTREIAREICLRQGLKAFIAAAIAKLGTTYVVTLEAVEAQTGASVALVQREATGQENVLNALGSAASDLRRQLGESLATLETFNTPIEQATTASLEALKAYSAAMDHMYREDGRSALPLFRRAIELDSDFVAAYDWGAWASALAADARGAAAFASTGFERRARATEREKLSMATSYHHFATGDWDEENRICGVWIDLFPKDWAPQGCHAFNFPFLGRFQDAIEAARAVIRLSPSIAQGYRLLAPALIRLGQFDEAARTIEEARARQLDNGFLRGFAWELAFLRGDEQAMDDALVAIGRHDARSETVARARLAGARGQWRRASGLWSSTQAPPVRGTAAPMALEAVNVRTALGWCDARDGSRTVAEARVVAGHLIYMPAIRTDGSFCGDRSEAERFVAALAARYPRATMAREVTLPILRAALAIGAKDSPAALDALRGVGPGSSRGFLPFYLRGQAHLLLGQHAEASTEFGVILDNPGWAPASPFYSLARLGLARAAAGGGDGAAARQAYVAFLDAWKEADPDVPAVVEARAELARLGG